MPGVRLGGEERETIGLGVARGKGFADIARRMRRPTSTVSREVTANRGRAWYRASLAHKASVLRGRRPRVRKLVANVSLAAVVTEGLKKRWSPAEVAAKLSSTIPTTRRCGCRTSPSTPRYTCRERAASSAS